MNLLDPFLANALNLYPLKTPRKLLKVLKKSKETLRHGFKLIKIDLITLSHYHIKLEVDYKYPISFNKRPHCLLNFENVRSGAY